MKSKITYFAGIDGGMNGGITVLDNNQHIVFCDNIPLSETSKGKSYNISEIHDIFDSLSKNCDEIHVVFEKAHSMPTNGVKAAFTTGQLYGEMLTILTLMKLPFEISSARNWQKTILAGQTVTNVKHAVIEYCRNKYPDFDFTNNGRSKKINDGKTDSCGIAIYCFMRNK